jgi:hypothetical protein
MKSAKLLFAFMVLAASISVAQNQNAQDALEKAEIRFFIQNKG